MRFKGGSSVRPAGDLPPKIFAKIFQQSASGQTKTATANYSYR
jgi:hypothetical protein